MFVAVGLLGEEGDGDELELYGEDVGLRQERVVDGVVVMLDDIDDEAAEDHAFFERFETRVLVDGVEEDGIVEDLVGIEMLEEEFGVDTFGDLESDVHNDRDGVAERGGDLVEGTMEVIVPSLHGDDAVHQEIIVAAVAVDKFDAVHN